MATHDATGQYVAIKYLSDELLADSGFRTGFRTEAQLLGQITSPNVVSLYEYVESSDGAAIVMELVDGASLRAMLEQHGPTEPEAALWVLKGSLLGLGAAHAVGVVHRDYKPENVLVDGLGDSKLTDFGVAARAGSADAVGGTPSYMPPEQWEGRPPTPRSDTYAATATFVECLTGRPPFDAPDLELLRRQHERAPASVDELPEPVRDLVRHGLAKEPSARPADAAAFLAELDRAAVSGYGEGWEDRGRAELARRAALLALLFPIAAAGLVGGTTIAATRLGGAPEGPPGATAPGTAPAAANGLAAGRGQARALRRHRAPIAAGIATGLLIGAGALAFGPGSAPTESAPVGPSSAVRESGPMPGAGPIAGAGPSQTGAGTDDAVNGQRHTWPDQPEPAVIGQPTPGHGTETQPRTSGPSEQKPLEPEFARIRKPREHPTRGKVVKSPNPSPPELKTPPPEEKSKPSGGGGAASKTGKNPSGSSNSGGSGSADAAPKGSGSTDAPPKGKTVDPPSHTTPDDTLDYGGYAGPGGGDGPVVK
jgi:serine/threonine-protein kinase